MIPFPRGRLGWGAAARWQTSEYIGGASLAFHFHRLCGGTPHPATPKLTSFAKAPHPSPTGEEGVTAGRDVTTLWRHRGFLHLWGAQATSAFGTRIGREAIALSAVMLLGSGPLDLAWLNLAMSLPYLVFGLAAGVLIDRVRRRPLLIATDLIRAGLLLTVPIAAWLGAFSLAQLLVVVFVVMACSLVFDCAHLRLHADPDREALAARRQCQAGIDRGRLGDRRPADRRPAGAGARRADRDPVRCRQLCRLGRCCCGACRTTRRRRRTATARASPGTISRSGSGSSSATACSGRWRSPRSSARSAAARSARSTCSICSAICRSRRRRSASSSAAAARRRSRPRS